MNRDELYTIIDRVLHARFYQYDNAGSFWVEQSDGDVQLRIHPLTEALCDALCKAVGDLTAERDASQLIISDLTAEAERLRALITEWDAARGCTAARTRQWDEGDWYRAEVRLGAAEGALIEEARREQ